MYINVLFVYYILLHHFGFRRYDLDNKLFSKKEKKDNKYILNTEENNEY